MVISRIDTSTARPVSVPRSSVRTMFNKYWRRDEKT